MQTRQSKRRKRTDWASIMHELHCMQQEQQGNFYSYLAVLKTTEARRFGHDRYSLFVEGTLYIPVYKAYFGTDLKQVAFRVYYDAVQINCEKKDHRTDILIYVLDNDVLQCPEFKLLPDWYHTRLSVGQLLELGSSFEKEYQELYASVYPSGCHGSAWYKIEQKLLERGDLLREFMRRCAMTPCTTCRECFIRANDPMLKNFIEYEHDSISISELIDFFL